jgi:hypothetical protein
MDGLGISLRPGEKSDRDMGRRNFAPGLGLEGETCEYKELDDGPFENG